jgi:hypothetical protein
MKLWRWLSRTLNFRHGSRHNGRRCGSGPDWALSLERTAIDAGAELQGCP